MEEGMNGREDGFLDLVLDEETNTFADPAKAHDGGGYAQPHRVWRGEWRGLPLEVEVFDTSCGGFGRRWRMLVTLGGRTVASEYDAVDRRDPEGQASCDEPLDDELDRFIAGQTGYGFNP